MSQHVMSEHTMSIPLAKLACVDYELLRWLVKNALDNEWSTHHAAENTYCQYCSNDDDSWSSQKEHHPGCEWVRMMELSKKECPDVFQVHDGR